MHINEAWDEPNFGKRKFCPVNGATGGTGFGIDGEPLPGHVAISALRRAALRLSRCRASVRRRGSERKLFHRGYAGHVRSRLTKAGGRQADLFFIVKGDALAHNLVQLAGDRSRQTVK